MKNSAFRQVFALVLFAALLAAMSSCNKGYGCPTNFKAAKAVMEIIK